jgi:hypothetical protein
MTCQARRSGSSQVRQELERYDLLAAVKAMPITEERGRTTNREGRRKVVLELDPEARSRRRRLRLIPNY